MNRAKPKARAVANGGATRAITASKSSFRRSFGIQPELTADIVRPFRIRSLRRAALCCRGSAEAFFSPDALTSKFLSK
jgi:hypothetical protein